MSGPARGRGRGDAVVRRHVAQWRRVTARLQVLMNAGTGQSALIEEAHGLQRQCERLALELRQVAERSRRPHQSEPAAGSGPT